MRSSPDSGRLLHAVDGTPRPAPPGREGAVAAGTGGHEAARRLAVSLSHEARLVLLRALTEADAPHHDGRPAAPETGRALAYGAGGRPSPGGVPGLTVVPSPSGPGTPRPEPGTGRPEGRPGAARTGDRVLWPVPRSKPPDGLIRLRFADAAALERADAAFGAAAGPGFGDACSDPATLTVRIAGDAGVETLRAVLAVLDASALTAESLTVHTHELDDVFASFTGLP